VTRSDGVFDLDPRHTPAAPVLRRIKNPADHDPLYAWLAEESPIVDVVAELIGPALRFHHSKLNLKGSHVGAPVEVHQDAAFYPHSNDDVLAVGLLLDDATAENGAMAVLPGSHRGPIHTHFDPQGRFVGCLRPEDIARLDRSRGAARAAGRQHPHPPLPARPLVGAQHVTRRPAPAHQRLRGRRRGAPGGGPDGLTALRAPRAGHVPGRRAADRRRHADAAGLQPRLHVDLRAPERRRQPLTDPAARPSTIHRWMNM